MKRTERSYGFVVSATVVAAYAAVGWLAVVTGGAPDSQEGWLTTAVIWTVVVIPSVIAAGMLWRAWCARTDRRESIVDGPALVMTAAATWLPADRLDWGAAMRAELAQVPAGPARWRFALGCARAAVLPPPGSGAPVLPVAALATGVVLAVWLAVGAALPPLRLFAVTFAGLLAVFVVVTVVRTAGRDEPGRREQSRHEQSWHEQSRREQSRREQSGREQSRREQSRSAGPAVATAGLAGVVACVVLTAYFVARYPSAADALGPTHAMLLAAVLAGVLWLTLLPSRALTSHRLARGIGLGGGLGLAAGLLVASRLPGGADGGALLFLLFAPAVVQFAGAALAARVARSLRAGLQAAAWITLLGAPLLFLVWLPEAVRWYHRGAGLLLDGESDALIGVNLRDAVFWVLVFVPAWTLPFGVIGAAAGARLGGALARLRRPTRTPAGAAGYTDRAGSTDAGYTDRAGKLGNAGRAGDPGGSGTAGDSGGAGQPRLPRVRPSRVRPRNRPRNQRGWVRR